MDKSPSYANLNSRHQNTPKTSGHISTDNLVDFVRERAILYRQKELAGITGLSLKQVQNLRMGISGVSGKTLTNWCRNDPVFAAEYAEYVGIIKPGEAEMSAALSRVINAAVRRGGAP